MMATTSNSDICEPKVNTKKKKKKYFTKYNEQWEKEPLFSGWLERSSKGLFCAYCNACKKHLSLKSGKTDLRKHIAGKKHEKNFQSFISEEIKLPCISRNVKLKELKKSSVTEHNLPTYRIEHVPKLLQSLRENSETVNNVHCGEPENHQEEINVDQDVSWTRAVVSKPAPNWEGTAVLDGEFTQLRLSDFKGKYLVLLFYPLDFSFECPMEILAFNDRIEEFRKINTEVVACSIDSHFTHRAWTKVPRMDGGLGRLSIPLLSDLTRKISVDYGVFMDDLGHTLRGLFVIDGRGIIRQITMNDLLVGRSVDETLRIVQALQYTDEHSEFCPSGWKPWTENMSEDVRGFFPEEVDVKQKIIPHPEEENNSFEDQKT